MNRNNCRWRLDMLVPTKHLLNVPTVDATAANPVTEYLQAKIVKSRSDFAFYWNGTSGKDDDDDRPKSVTG